MRVAARLALVAAVVALPSACSRDDEYRLLVRAECLPESADVVGVREADPPTVDCDEPHRYEVYGTSTIEGPRTYPGEATVDELAEHECYLLFEPNVGVPAERMPADTKVVFLAPSPSSWNDGDRDVECLLIFDGDRRGRLIPAEPIAPTTTGDPAGSTTTLVPAPAP